MADKAFNKKLSHRCEYCVYGKPLGDGREIVCRKRGVTLIDDTCRKYKYDPLKRNPDSVKIKGDFTAEDFSI